MFCTSSLILHGCRCTALSSYLSVRKAVNSCERTIFSRRKTEFCRMHTLSKTLLCSFALSVFGFLYLLFRRQVSDHKTLSYTCRRSLKTARFFAHSHSQKFSLFSCRSNGAHGAPHPVFPVSHANRYNTLHFASKVVCQRGHPFGNPRQQNRRYAALSGSIPPFLVIQPSGCIG